MSRREMAQESSQSAPRDRSASVSRKQQKGGAAQTPAPQATADHSPRDKTPSSATKPMLLASGGAILSFRVADQRYGLPVACVRQIIEMVAFTPLPGAPEMVAGVIDFHGQVIPLLDMRSRLLQPPQPYTLRTPIVIAQLDEYLAGLVVDAVIGVVEIPPEQLEAPEKILSRELAPRPLYLAAVAPQPEGLLLVLDPSAILPRSEKRTLARALAYREETVGME